MIQSPTPVFDAVTKRWRQEHGGTVPWREEEVPTPVRKRALSLAPVGRAATQQAAARRRRRI